jgi:2-polyprenyl-3-methyl-5-hydroxy-6-metoxy-1,4-benzoquinol methylase
MSIGDTDYRQRFYDQYATLVMRTGETLDLPAVRRWGRAYDHYLRGWLPRSRDASVLDVACGAGRLLLFMKERGFVNVTGVDLSPEQIARARQVIPDVVQSELLEYLAANPGRFDLIVGLDVIEHLEKPRVVAFFDAAFASLRPGGRLIVETVNGDTPMGLPILYGDFTHETCFTPQSLVSLFRLSGFDGIAIRETGPVPWGYSLKSTVRYLIWRVFRYGLQLANTAETGSSGSGVFTRVMLASGVKSGPAS